MIKVEKIVFTQLRGPMPVYYKDKHKANMSRLQDGGCGTLVLDVDSLTNEEIIQIVEDKIKCLPVKTEHLDMTLYNVDVLNVCSKEDVLTGKGLTIVYERSFVRRFQLQ